MHDAGHPVKVKFAFRVRTWIGSTQNKKLRQRAKKTDDKNLKDQSTKSKLGQNARRGKRMHSGKLETPMFGNPDYSNNLETISRLDTLAEVKQEKKQEVKTTKTQIIGDV